MNTRTFLSSALRGAADFLRPGCEHSFDEPRLMIRHCDQQLVCVRTCVKCGHSDYAPAEVRS